MILFDKIKQVFFTEEDEGEEYIEEIQEDRDFEETEKSVVYKKPKPKPEVKIDRVIERVEPVKSGTSTSTSTFNITADGPKPAAKPERRLKPIERKEFEMPQVISPIHGSGVEDEKPVQNPSMDFIPRKSEKKNTLGTVVSPFYGEIELEEFHNQAQTKIAKDQILQEEVEFIDDEEVENVSLDQIITNDVEDEDEMIQFSLFGDNRSVKSFAEDETKESLFGVEEKDDNDEDLPF